MFYVQKCSPCPVAYSSQRALTTDVILLSKNQFRPAVSWLNGLWRAVVSQGQLNYTLALGDHVVITPPPDWAASSGSGSSSEQLKFSVLSNQVPRRMDFVKRTKHGCSSRLQQRSMDISLNNRQLVQGGLRANSLLSPSVTSISPRYDINFDYYFVVCSKKQKTVVYSKIIEV